MRNATDSMRRRVLVVDDMETVHDSFRKILEPRTPTSSFAAAKSALLGGSAEPASGTLNHQRFEVDFALQGQVAVEKAAAAFSCGAPYLVAFVDMRMPPGWDGVTTIKHLWEVDPNLQVVVCTAFSDTPLESLADELGHAHQMLILKKPFDAVEVLQMAAALTAKCIAHSAARLQMDELEHLVQERTGEIEHALLHDKLTGLPNRAMLLTRLESCLQRQQRHPDNRFAVLFLDFDRFKMVNDSLGHEIGDLLLIEIAQRLQISLRGADFLCHQCLPSRLGGDEFIILLEDLRGEHDAARVAQRLIDTLSEPYLLENQKLVVTVSIGVTTSDRKYDRASDMVRDADTAMYRAKAAGRARYVIFDRTMHAEVTERLFLETELRKAVRQEELILHYQPIVSLEEGDLVGFEALVRWNLPSRGMIPAPTIISIAEETGLIQPLTLSLLRKACDQLHAWQMRCSPGKKLMMSVNFSRRLVLDPDIVNKMAQIIQEAGVDPGSIILEITESVLLAEKDAAPELFSRFKELGVWLHLDDFGTGYSSLSCLYSLPLNGLKIDRSFLIRACANTKQLAVLEAIVNIARALQLSVTVEGIETTEQLGILRSLGIQLGQGYLFGAPCDAEHASAAVTDAPTLCHS